MRVECKMRVLKCYLQDLLSTEFIILVVKYHNDERVVVSYDDGY